MSRFIELTTYHGGKRVLFNIDSIETVYEGEESLEICTPEGDYYYFSETYEEAKTLIKYEVSETDRRLFDIAQMLNDLRKGVIRQWKSQESLSQWNQITKV